MHSINGTISYNVWWEDKLKRMRSEVEGLISTGLNGMLGPCCPAYALASKDPLPPFSTELKMPSIYPWPQTWPGRASRR